MPLLLPLLYNSPLAPDYGPPTRSILINITKALPAIKAVMNELPLPTTSVMPMHLQTHIAANGPQVSELLNLPPSSNPNYPVISLGITSYGENSPLEKAIAQFQYLAGLTIPGATGTIPNISVPEALKAQTIQNWAYSEFILLREPPENTNGTPEFEIGALQLHYDKHGFVLAPILTSVTIEKQTNMQNTLADAAALLMAYLSSENMMPFEFDTTTTEILHQQELFSIPTQTLKPQ